MAPSQSPGILIVFDGIDGAGKTTQVNLLRDILERSGLEVVVSKEPTNGKWGKIIRDSAITGRMPIEMELEYFIRDRQEHLETLVNPALSEGKIVILDRYYYSTICYQGARGQDKEMLRDKVTSVALTPDISFILDVSPEISQSRIVTRDGIPNEFENIEELKRVREIYDWLCHVDTTLYEIDSSLPIPVIFNTILKLFVDNPLKAKFCFKKYGCEDSYTCGYRMSGMCNWSKLKDKIFSLAPNTDDACSALKYHKGK